MEKKRVDGLNGKDLMNVGIFTALFLIIYISVTCILGLIPILSLTSQFFSSFVLGIPMMLYFAKIKKFGMIVITYTVNGILMVLLGLGVWSLILGIICALIAELILYTGKYQNVARAAVAFAITCVGANGNSVYWVFGSQEFLQKTAASMGEEYMNTVVHYFSYWWVLPTILLSAFLGGLLGGLLGKRVLKKHFIRSGVV